MGIRKVLAFNLRQHRRAGGLSQEELAYQADIDRTYISAIERCKYAASIDVLERLATALKIDVHQLLKAPESPRRRRAKPLEVE